MKSSTKTFLQLSLGIAVLIAAIPLLWNAPKSPENVQINTENELKIVVSIAPLHSLVAGITKGISEPQLLLKSGETPHHYSLKPRDAALVGDADVLIATSFESEYYLAALAKSSKDQKLTLQMIDAEGITLLSQFDSEEGNDMHLWLDPQNAMAFSKQVAAELAKFAPKHAEKLHENLQKQLINLQKMDKFITKSTPKNAEAGYVSYHSVLQYYEHRYGIKSAPPAVTTPEAGASVAEAEKINARAEAGELKCVLAETEFSSKLLDGVAEKHPEIKRLTLDPLGSQFEPSAELYGQLMEHVTEVVNQCLK